MSRGCRYFVSYSNPNLSPVTPSCAFESCRFAFWQTECISYGHDTNELGLASPPFESLGMERASAWEVDDDETAF